MNQEDHEYFIALSDLELLARCIWGEARGEPVEGKVAVAAVIKNRIKGVARYGVTLKSVILKPWQFSCFLPKDPNFDLIRTGIPGKTFNHCKFVAGLSLKGLLVDNTRGATHYHVADMEHPPNWSKSKQMFFKRQIGNHKFYEEI